MAEEARDRWRFELLTYVCFTIPASFAPIAFRYVMRLRNGYHLTIREVLADDGILAIAISLAADALARLVTSGKKWRDAKIIATAGAAWVMGGGSFLYALRYPRSATTSVVLVNLEFLFLVLSIAIATFCRFLPENDQ